MKKWDIKWFTWLYIALAVATFKHSSWAFSTRIEGTEPFVDWANFELTFVYMWQVGTLAVWYLFGGLMAAAVDVGMFATAKAIREHYKTPGNKNKQPIALWGVYLVVASLSAISQLLYAVQHAAPLDIQNLNVAALQAGGWLATIMDHTVILLPVMLPVMGFLFTVAAKVSDDQIEPQGGIDAITGDIIYTVKQMAQLTGKSASWIRALAQNKVIGYKSASGQWLYTDNDLNYILSTKGLPSGRSNQTDN